jgi:large subunit ribosomal protein L13
MHGEDGFKTTEESGAVKLTATATALPVPAGGAGGARAPQMVSGRWSQRPPSATLFGRPPLAVESLMKTYVATPATRERNWLVVDASGKTLGRLATQIADALRGKRKPEYTPHVDVGDFVIVVNAEKITVTGNKRAEKRYYRHSGYPGGLRSRTLEEMLDRRPEEVIRLAVKGMLPRNRLGRAQLRKLKVYAGPDHPHVAQKPEPMEVVA